MPTLQQILRWSAHETEGSFSITFPELPPKLIRQTLASTYSFRVESLHTLFEITVAYCNLLQSATTNNHVSTMDVGRGGRAPLDFEIIRKKRLFFQFRGVKTKFHHFWAPPGKVFGKIPHWPWKNSFRRPWFKP